MADFTTAARPYARAAFEFAREAGQFDQWSNQLGFLAALLEHPDMQARLEAPDATFEDRATMLKNVAGEALDESGANFVRLLAENNRLKLIPDVYRIYQSLRREAEGEIEASVVSAFELDEAQCNKIADALSKRLARKVRLVNTVDDSLVGGAIIRAGDLVIDGSLKGRIEKMSNAVAV